MFFNILKGLGKKVLGRTGQKAAVEGGERAVRSITREVTQSARGATPRVIRQQTRAVRRSPTKTAEDYFLRPESPRIQTQAVSRNGRDTVARAGEAEFRQAGEVSPISRIRGFGRRVAYGPKAGTRATPVDLTRAQKLGAVVKRGGTAGVVGSIAAIGALGRGDKAATEEGYDFLPAESVLPAPPDVDATQDELDDYEQLIREEALARTGQFDPFAPEDSGMGAGGAAGAAGGDIYGNVRGGFNDWASNMRGYGTAKGAGIRSTYEGLSGEALADAAKAEAIAQAASGDIGRIGTDYAEQATQDIQSPGANRTYRFDPSYWRVLRHPWTYR